MPRGLRHVNLSYCSLSPKGLTNLSNALTANKLNPQSLTYLNLAGNTLKDESHALCAFLAQPNVIAILDLSATETPLDALFGALVRGCTSALTHLNLSRNPFSSKKAKEIPASFKQFFAGTLVLQYLNMAHCKMPAEAVKHLLLGLACNEATANVELTLNNNNFGANGANVFESCIGGVKCISRLDLSENNIDAEVGRSLKYLIRVFSVGVGTVLNRADTFWRRGGWILKRFSVGNIEAPLLSVHFWSLVFIPGSYMEELAT